MPVWSTRSSPTRCLTIDVSAEPTGSRQTAGVSVVRVRVVVEGRVQGVFYRDSCRREATRLGVRGSVRNRPDGSVEVVAEGERERVDALLTWCREGPPRASVTRISVTDEVPAAERSFRIEY